MSYATFIRLIELGESVGFSEARALGAALLEGGAAGGRSTIDFV